VACFFPKLSAIDQPEIEGERNYEKNVYYFGNASADCLFKFSGGSFIVDRASPAS
jgi:hypothetical protein